MKKQQNPEKFATAVVRWQKKHGRHNLPWQNDNSPYTIWLSEIMLQQTQVAAVIPYYQRFLLRFPDIATLAQARQDSVLTAWSGLGYYARARNLHKAAKLMHKNGVPTTHADWLALPGIGKTTASAIMVFTQQAPFAVLDGNIKRVLARTYMVSEPPTTPAGLQTLWTLAESLLPQRRTIHPYTQGLMDLGAGVCRRLPLCHLCPLTAHCRAYQQNTTAQYPKKIAKPSKPEKQAVMLLMHDGEHVFLQKRPSRGIWGGLWTLPEAPTKKALWAEWAALEKSAESTKSTKSAKSTKPPTPTKTIHFTHEFTHYRLHATVYCCTAANKNPQPTVGKWVRFGNLSRFALPAPLRLLLEGFPAEK